MPADPLAGALAGDLRVVFQPVVDLERDVVVGYEALARGPRGTDLEHPEALFAEARREGLVPQLDRACRELALGEATAAPFGETLSLFVNAEPEALGVQAAVLEVSWEERAGARCLVEVTERALTDRPAELLAAVERIRSLGWGIALDDVGATTDSVVLMPFLEPDVIKLDLRLLHQQPSDDVARIVHAVGAQAERTGATIVAEGIETEAHRTMARAMGAHLGQGWLLGRPGPLPLPPPRPRQAVPLLYPPLGSALRPTPFELVTSRTPMRHGHRPLLEAVVGQIEEQAVAMPLPPVVLAAFPDADLFDRATAERFAGLAERLAFIGALGPGIVRPPAEGVRGGPLVADDPVRHEWAVVVVGAHLATAFAARSAADHVPDDPGLFDFAVTYDRDLAVRCARSLMARVAPAGTPVTSS